MRKGIVRGLLPALVIGLVVVWVLLPRRGSVAWHKRELSTALARWEGNTAMDKVKRLWGKVTGQAVTWQMEAEEANALVEKMDEHRLALIEAGYLVERRFTTTNNAQIVSMRCASNRDRMIPKEHREFAWIADAVNSNAVTVIGRPEDFPKWEEMIRKLDGN